MLTNQQIKKAIKLADENLATSLRYLLEKLMADEESHVKAIEEAVKQIDISSYVSIGEDMKFTLDSDNRVIPMTSQYDIDIKELSAQIYFKLNPECK